MPFNREQQARAIQSAVGFARGRPRAETDLLELFRGGVREARLSPRWYAELAGELAGAGLLDGRRFPSPRLPAFARIVGYYLWPRRPSPSPGCTATTRREPPPSPGPLLRLPAGRRQCPLGGRRRGEP